MATTAVMRPQDRKPAILQEIMWNSAGQLMEEGISELLYLILRWLVAVWNASCISVSKPRAQDFPKQPPRLFMARTHVSVNGCLDLGETPLLLLKMSSF